MSTESTLAAWLREQMPRKGYPVSGPRSGGITRLAQDAGISQATMSRLVNGQGEPSVDSLRKLGAIFGRTLAEMMTIAGLADSAEVGPGSATQPGRPTFTVHEGGGEDWSPPQPAALTEDEFNRILERGEEPPTPPEGFRHRDEKIIWALTQPPQWRWDAIRTLRQLMDASAARRAKRQQDNQDPKRPYRPHNDDPRRQA